MQRDTYSLNSGQGEGQKGVITELQTLLGHLGEIAPYITELNGKAKPDSEHVQLVRVIVTVVTAGREHIHCCVVLRCLQLPLAGPSTAVSVQLVS